ncbi:MAG: hypothetical protein GY859_26065 [Desulfobacterales bacterium]|nr:hypothetical protein [Desulfobacterales bacterium]
MHYAEGVLLNADDFEAEQTYHRGRLARALSYLHGGGTAAGLKVEWEESYKPGMNEDYPEGREERLKVNPGIAIDRLGRIIEVGRAACIRLADWYAWRAAETPGELLEGFHTNFEPGVSGIVADVFIRFFSCAHGKTPAFASGPFDALDAVTPSRLRDFYDIDFIIRREQNPPLPEDPWPDPSGNPQTDRAARREAVLDAWREGTQWSDLEGLTPLAEHAPGQDPASLFLARVLIPAGPNGVDPPTRIEGDVMVNNDIRPFVYPAGLMAKWL